MACWNVRQASFRILAYGASAHDIMTGKVGPYEEDLHDTGLQFTASVDRMGEILAADELINNALKYFHHDPTKPLQMWQISAILLADVYHFSHGYFTSYVATPFDNAARDVMIKYGSAPTWRLKRIL